ncbi:MAG: dihydrodipicolinate reductase [Paracoccaceae bacterium]
MCLRLVLTMCLVFAFASGAQAEYTKVNEKSEFVRLVTGKILTRPWVQLRVTEDGRIEGTGARWSVSGAWSWRDGYFCRDLFWGGDDLGYNCQEVRASAAGHLRFISDKGEGRSAGFRLQD